MSPELRYSIITVTGPLLSSESVLYGSPTAVGNGSPISDVGNRKSQVCIIKIASVGRLARRKDIRERLQECCNPVA